MKPDESEFAKFRELSERRKRGEPVSTKAPGQWRPETVFRPKRKYVHKVRDKKGRVIKAWTEYREEPEDYCTYEVQKEQTSKEWNALWTPKTPKRKR